MGKYANLEERLLANSVRADFVFPEQDWSRFLYDGTFCWIWTGPYRTSGYPQISFRFKSGPRKGKVKTDGAHRVSLRVFRGRTLRAKYVARHLCNNRCCINPMHLRGGTHAQNTDDMMKAGTHRTPFVKPDSPNHTSNRLKTPWE